MPRQPIHADMPREPPLIHAAIALWIVFAAGICIATLLKPDLIQVKGSGPFAARVMAEDATSLRIVRADGPRAQETIAKADLVERIRYGARSVTPEYHRATVLWWHAQSPYTEGVHGFLYLPQFITIYTPFALLPPALEETLWRLLGIALYAGGIASLCRVLIPQRFGAALLIASGLAIFAALGSAANGQTNVHIGGLLALGTAAIAERRWWRAVVMLLLALALKPTALVLLLLVAAIYVRPMLPRLAIGLVIFLAIPQLHPEPNFPAYQYHECLVKMAAAADPGDRFQDIRGMLMDFGLVRVFPGGQSPPEIVLMAIRAAAALATLGLCWLAARRFGDPARAIFVLTLGVTYLMLFSPRTEGVTYAIMGPVAALWATRELLDRRWLGAVPLIAYCLILQFSRQISGGEGNYWVRPLATILFAAAVITELARGRTFWPSSR